VLFVLLISGALANFPLLGRNGPCTAHPLKIRPSQVIHSSNIGADPISTAHSCSGVTSVSGTVWYSFAAPTGTVVNLSTCDPYTDYSNVLVLYTGSCSNPVCQQVGTISGTCSTLSWVSTGAYAMIGVAANGASTGSFALSVNIGPTTTSSCQTPIHIPVSTPGYRLLGSSHFGTNNEEICSGYTGYPVTWYTFAVQQYFDIEINACNLRSNYPILGLYSNSCQSLSCIAWGCGVYQTLGAGSYFLAVLVRDTKDSDFQLDIRFNPVLPTSCNNPGYILDLHYGYSSYYGSLAAQNPISDAPTCGAVGPAYWLSLVAAPDANVTLATCLYGTTFDAIITVYEGDNCDSLICVPTVNLSGDCGHRNGTVVSFIAKDTSYSVAITSADSVQGDFELVARYPDEFYWYVPDL